MKGYAYMRHEYVVFPQRQPANGPDDFMYRYANGKQVESEDSFFLKMI